MKHHIIQALVDIHQSETHCNVIRVDEITDDKLQEILLTVEASITYNNKNIATKVRKNIGNRKAIFNFNVNTYVYLLDCL